MDEDCNVHNGFTGYEDIDGSVFDNGVQID
jgi:hypothetical protein